MQAARIICDLAQRTQSRCRRSDAYRVEWRSRKIVVTTDFHSERVNKRKDRWMTTMKAAVIHEAGGPKVLKIESLPSPTPQSGEVLIRVKAFGLNRSELFTRQGHSPTVKFPRILGIEAAGVVEEAPGGEFQKGAIVLTAMGGMGRQIDGGYAEFTCVPATQVQQVETKLDWKTLGAIPEMLQTSWGSL